VLAVEREPALAAPEPADDADPLLERRDDLGALRRHLRAEGPQPDRVASGTDPEFDPPPAQHVERGRRLGQHYGRPERQGRDVGPEPDPRRGARQRRQQRPGVVVGRHVGVVLNGDQVDPGRVGDAGAAKRLIGILDAGVDVEAELRGETIGH